MNELIKKYLSPIIIYIRISYKRRKILDFAVINNNSSLVGYLYFLYLPWYCLFFSFFPFFFPNRTTLNVDFGNKTNTWISKCFCLWAFYCLGISLKVHKPLIFKIPLCYYNPVSQIWLRKGTKFSTELVSTHLLCVAVSG